MADPKMARNTLAEQIVMTTAYGLVVFSGLFLNAWAALTISTRGKLRNTSYIFMISLAMADFLTDLLVLPWFIVAMWTDDWDITQGPWPMIVKYLPMLVSYLCWVLRFISIVSVPAIAASKYHVLATESSRTDKSIISGVATVFIWWHGLVSTALPRILSDPSSSVCLTTFSLPSYMRDNVESFSDSEYAIEVNVLVVYVTSLLLTVYLYNKIRIHTSSGAKYYIRRTTKQIEQLEQLHIHPEANVQLLREGVVVIDETAAREVYKRGKSTSGCQAITGFVVLWTPYLVFSLYRAFTCGNKCKDSQHIFRYVDFALTWLTFVSTIANPIIYVLRNQQLKYDIQCLTTDAITTPNDRERIALEEIKYKSQRSKISNVCRYEAGDDEIGDDVDESDDSTLAANEDEQLISVSTINLHELETGKQTNANKTGEDYIFKSDPAGYLKNDDTDSGLVINRIRPHSNPQSPKARHKYDPSIGDGGSLPRGTNSSTSDFDDSDSSGVWLKSNGEEASIKPILKTFLPRVDEISLDRPRVNPSPTGSNARIFPQRTSGSELIVVPPKPPVRKNVNFVEPSHSQI